MKIKQQLKFTRIILKVFRFQRKKKIIISRNLFLKFILTKFINQKRFSKAKLYWLNYPAQHGQVILVELSSAAWPRCIG